MLVHSTTLHVHQPFDTVMENSGVKTRSSEQTMLSDEVHISLVTNSSSEEDSKIDDQSYFPRGVCSTWQGYVGHIMYMAPCIAYIIHLICHQLSLDFLCVNAPVWFLYHTPTIPKYLSF